MCPENRSVPAAPQPAELATRPQMQAALNRLLAAVEPYCQPGASGIPLGHFTAHYGPRVAEMEALARLLWGIFPLLAGGGQPAALPFCLTAIDHGTDPAHPGYWGEVGEYDQRCVEMAAFGVGMALLGPRWQTLFAAPQQQRITAWLAQGAEAAIPDNNWHYFPILVQVGFHRTGQPYDADCVARHFASMERYYLGDGWYADGPGRPRDYYISMGFHFYGLLYATLMADEDPARAACLRERATAFAQDFIHQFAADGSAIPFGRSLTYRFAEGAFWSAVAFSGLPVFSPGVVKGLVLRHLRHWLQQPIFDRDGVLSIGYHYPNLVMAEDYNAPGSPYWALKLFLVLALPEEGAFWQAEEQPLPPLDRLRALPHASQLIVRDAPGDHLYLLTAGQLELNNFVNSGPKYTKFAYSNRFGFCLERGRYGLPHAAVDSMLLLAEEDEYWRGRRECHEVVTRADLIFCRWSPWRDVQVASWLIPAGDGHLRLHHLVTARQLACAEGGFAVIAAPDTRISQPSGGRCEIAARNGVSVIQSLDEDERRQAEWVRTPPNNNLMFAETAAIPVLRGVLPPGEHWLACWVAASPQPQPDDPPQLVRTAQRLTLTFRHGQRHIWL
ncbi:DUF2264 domain-containing protein [Nissabacter sp. SGAir0207]|uniref:DUF2264 domain-containing protein n=1 Tax=Nissabacter sp. SGAir0207 TaxID=2126321 RepID=UPI0026804C02